MSTLVARIISDIANPLVFSFPASFLLVYGNTQNVEYSLKWGVISFLFASLIGFFVVLGVVKKVFTDFDVSKQKNRSLLFVLILSALFLYLVFLYLTNGPQILIIAVFAVIVSAFVMSIVTFWIKASIHTSTTAAFFITISIVYGGLYALGLIFIPIVMWARIKTKRHTVKEAFLGGLLGTLFTVVSYMVIKGINL